MIGLIVGGLIAGGVGIASGVAKRNAQSKAQKEELRRQQENLRIAKNNLTDSYNLNMRQAEEVTKQANDLINLQAGQTEAARDLGIKNAGTSGELSDRLAASQIATLQVESSQQEGQAVQNVALSGFRNTGSALNIIKDVSSKAQSAVRQAFLQRSVSRFSDYASARNNYLNAENQLQLYQAQIESNESELARTKEKYTLTYNQQLEEMQRESGYVQSDQDFMNSSTYKWMQGLGYASDIFGGIATGVSFVNAGMGLSNAFGSTASVVSGAVRNYASDSLASRKSTRAPR